MTTFLEKFRFAMSNLGEEGINDELTEPSNPLEIHWRVLDVNHRAEIRTQWRNRLLKEFDHALQTALLEQSEEEIASCTCGDKLGTYSRHGGNPNGHASTCPQLYSVTLHIR